MKVKELMSTDELKYCTPDASLRVVARTMKKNNRGALPVVDSNHKVIGIITDRDICLSLGSKADKPVSELTVQDVIRHSKVHTVSVDQPISVALSEMRRNRVGRLPVTDKEGRLKGMLSINNLLTHALDHPKALGATSAQDETLAKTIKALFERNRLKPSTVAENALPEQAAEE